MAERESPLLHQSWHVIEPNTVSMGWGWCVDCQRTVALGISRNENHPEVDDANH